MPRYIDADMLRQRMYHEAFETDTDMQKWDSGCWIRYKLFENCIDDMPTISPDDARGVGKWEDAKQHGLCRCSVCKDCYIEKGYITQAKWRFCPNCGAKMEVSEDA